MKLHVTCRNGGGKLFGTFGPFLAQPGNVFYNEIRKNCRGNEV